MELRVLPFQGGIGKRSVRMFRFPRIAHFIRLDDLQAGPELKPRVYRETTRGANRGGERDRWFVRRDCVRKQLI